MTPQAAIAASATVPGVAAESAKAEFFLCLARAFQPMRTPAARAALARELAGELADLGRAAGYDVERLAQEFGGCVRELEPRLLEDYSALFLVPPVPVPLNAGLYLDGGLMGRSTVALIERYGEAGLAPDERFGDLPDHVSMQLEFVAVMLMRAAEGDALAGQRARDLLGQFVLAWAPPLAQALHRAEARVPAARAFRHLTEILERAARQEALRQPEGE